MGVLTSLVRQSDFWSTHLTDPDAYYDLLGRHLKAIFDNILPSKAISVWLRYAAHFQLSPETVIAKQIRRSCEADLKMIWFA